MSEDSPTYTTPRDEADSAVTLALMEKASEAIRLGDRLAAMEQVAMDGSPPVSALHSTYLARSTGHAGPFGFIKWQTGPVQENGVNGTTLEDVIDACIARLKAFNDGPFRCRENSLAITSLEEARNWLLQRTRDRVERGVEGTNHV